MNQFTVHSSLITNHKLIIKIYPMKKLFLTFVLLTAVTHVTFAQCGFVAVAYDDNITRSAASVGQMFTQGVSVDGNYANEGLQQSFLYRGNDTLLYENSSYPVAYRPAERIPQGNPPTVNVGETPVYLLPTQGLDSLISVMAYGVTFTNDTTVVAPYNVCEHNFDLFEPLVLPAGSVPPVQYYNNKPTTYPVGAVTPVTWNFSVADKSLTDTQQVNVKFPPCGNDNFLTYTPEATEYPFVQQLDNPYLATDFEGHSYNTVRIDCHCWTKENLKSTQYADGESIANPMAYVSDDHTDAAANVERYGYLYTWDAAVRIPLNPDAAGNVQGVCPQGWHLPNAEEFGRLAHYPAADLMSVTDWINVNGTDATGFTALPAGFYTGARFENLLGETCFWTATPSSTLTATFCDLRFGCSEMLVPNGLMTTGKSVRCLKSN